MQLHKHDVVAAATAILDSYGIADLTMRRLARELDITPGALYWHFANKQQLLGAVADRLLEPVCTVSRVGVDTADWQPLIGQICTAMHDALLAHTDGAELVSASFAAGQSAAATEVLGGLSGIAAGAGLEPEQAELAARALIYYVLGATADEQSRLRWADALPDGSAGFAFGLRLLIDGLAAQSADRMLSTVFAVPPA